ncbi:MAG TPA: glycosyltransferase [Acetobacteraceae bacterium]|nr:glycosyltransferase [Acetobacteraceae bacterium]
MQPELLFVSPRFLFPLDEGGKIRTAGILRALRGGAFRITLASPAPPNAVRFTAETESVCDRFVSWPEQHPTPFRRALAVAGRLPASAASDCSQPGRRIVAAEAARGPAVLVADFPHSAVLLPRSLPAASIMFTHNVEAEILERHAALATGWRGAVWRREAAKMSRFEGETLRRFASVIAVSERDAVALAARYDLAHVPRIDTGVDLAYYRFQSPRADATTVVFSGAMDSRSNIDGIEFLLREIWPLVAVRMKSARMHVVGRNPPAALVAEARDRGYAWHFTGTVADIRPHLGEGDVAAIPLRVGSGTRLKAFEAMATGLPVVATTLGVEGLGLAPGTDYVAADSAADFASALITLLQDYPRRQSLATAGRTLLEERYGWDRIGRQFEAICTAALSRASRG